MGVPLLNHIRELLTKRCRWVVDIRRFGYRVHFFIDASCDIDRGFVDIYRQHVIKNLHFWWDYTWFYWLRPGITFDDFILVWAWETEKIHVFHVQAGFLTSSLFGIEFLVAFNLDFMNVLRSIWIKRFCLLQHIIHVSSLVKILLHMIISNLLIIKAVNLILLYLKLWILYW